MGKGFGKILFFPLRLRSFGARVSYFLYLLVLALGDNAT